MDRNQILGIVLISVMLLSYLYISKDDAPIEPQKTTQSDSTSTEEQPGVDTSIAETDTLGPAVDTAGQAMLPILDSAQLDSQNRVLADSKYGIFAAHSTGEGKEIYLENNLIKIWFNTYGGNVTRVQLKQFKTWKKDPLILLDEQSNHFNHQVIYRDKRFSIDSLYYGFSGNSGMVEKGDENTIKFKLNLGGDKYITKTYSLKDNVYTLDYSLKLNDLKKTFSGSDLNLVWADNIKKTEKVKRESLQRSYINYWHKEDGYDKTRGSMPPISNIKWFSHKQRFFNAGMISQVGFKSIRFNISPFPEADEEYVTSMRSSVRVPLSHLSGNKGNFTFYFGPNDFDICKPITEGYKKNVDLGWTLFAFLNRNLVIPIFNMLHSIFGDSYGLIILFTVIIIKILLFPIAFRSYKSMARMKVLKPWIEEIRKKHGDNKQKIQMEQMSLYRKVGVNPVAGCIPQLLQIPIFLALFNFFPNSIELRQTPFLWADDLSSYDAPITWDGQIPLLGDHLSLFTLLMTLSTLAYTYYNNQINAATGAMKNIGYIMPIMFFFVLNNFSSGLTYYYFLNTAITIGQQLIAMRFIDKEKIRLAMEENRKNAESGDGGGKKGKSKFMQRLEEAQKVAEERRKNRKK